MGIILIVILVLLFIGALPTQRHSKSWGPYPSGGIGPHAGCKIQSFFYKIRVAMYLLLKSF